MDKANVNGQSWEMHYEGAICPPSTTQDLISRCSVGTIRCRIHTFQACSFSHSDTSPNFGLWFNVFSQHDVRCAVALERGVIYWKAPPASTAFFT